MNMMGYVSEHEKQTGIKLHPQVISYLEKLDKTGKRFEEKGRKDASNCIPAPSSEIFQTWGKRVFDDDPEMAQAIGRLMQCCYMDGYEGRSNSE